MDLFVLISPSAILTLCFLLSSFIIIILTKKSNEHSNLPPGTFGWPFIGETIELGNSCRKGIQDRFITDRMSRYSSQVFKTSLMGEKIAVVCGPVGNKLVYSNQGKLVKSWLIPTVAKILMPDFESNSEEEVVRRRNTIIKFLKPDVVHKYIYVMDSTVRQHMESEWAPHSTVKVHDMARKLAFTLSSLLFMGVKDQRRMAKLQNMFNTVTSAFLSLPVDLPGTKVRRAINAYRLMLNEVKDIIDEEKPKKKDESESWNMMSYLFNTDDEDGKFLNDMEIASMLVGMLIASHDTVSSLITSLVFFLADHPHVYSRALKEQIEIMETLNDPEKLLTFEDTKKMKYGRNVIDEVLRVAPPTIGTFREAMQDINYAGFTMQDIYGLCKTLKYKNPLKCIFLSVHSTHKDPKYFADPEKFDPDRFERNTHAPYSFTPFGGGARMCPGHEYARQATLLLMHHLLLNYTFHKLNPTEKLIVEHVTVPANGLPLKIIQRPL